MSEDDDFSWGWMQLFLYLVCIAFGAAVGLASAVWSEPDRGTECGACYGNGTCNQGLVCASERCVKLPALDAGAGQ